MDSKIKKSIEIDIEVYRIIEQARINFDETHNDILKRLLGNYNSYAGRMFNTYSDRNEMKNMSFSKNEINLNEPHNVVQYHKELLQQRLDSVNNTTKEWIYKNARLPEGAILQKWYMGKKYEAVIQNGAIFFNGEYYLSPSKAAMAITQGNVNGWTFWEYFNEKANAWEKLDELRAK